MKKIVLSTIAAIMSFVGVSNAEVIRVDGDNGEFKIVVHDVIEYDQDAAKLQALLDTPGFNGWVQLDSRGGSVWEGWKMAKMIRDAAARTFVSDDNNCMSACTYVFMGGVERYVSEGFTLGYHPAFITKFDGDTSFNGAYREGQVDALDTAYRFSYFVEEGMEFNLIRFLAVAYDNSDKKNFYIPEVQELVDAGIVTHTY